MGATESVVQQHLTNQRDIDIFNELKNSTQQICEQKTSSSNIFNATELNCETLESDQSNSGKATCYLSSILDNLDKTSLNTSAQNDLVADAVAKGGIFPAESSVIQDVMNSESYKFNKSTINEAISKCAQELIGDNVINLAKTNCGTAKFKQTNESWAECLQKNDQKNVIDTDVKSTFVTGIEGTAEAIGLDPAGSSMVIVAGLFVVLIIVAVVMLGGTGSGSGPGLMSKNVKIMIGLCLCCLCLSVIAAVVVYFVYDHEKEDDDEK